MIDTIFDIAHEAFVHQQKQDSEEIDHRNWHEWIQHFVEGLPIQQESPSTADESSPEKKESSENNIDFLELKDYLDNKGQWPTKLVSENKPNLESIFGGGSDATQATGKGKNVVKSPTGGETGSLEDTDLVISD